MKPEELADFAHEIRGFSPTHIDRLHRVLLRLEEDHVDAAPDHIRREYNAVYLENGRSPKADDPCLQWLLDLADIQSQTPLNERFLDVLQEANIVLTTEGTVTDGGTEDEGSRRAVSFEQLPLPSTRAISPDSLDQDDRLWRQAIALDERKLGSQALEQWRLKLHLRHEALLINEDPAMNQIADDLYRRNLARKAITHWRNTVKEMQDLERVAIEFRAKRDAASVLKTWTLAARESLFTRVRDERALLKSLGTWREKMADIKEMEVAADAIYDRQAAQHVFDKVMSRKSHIEELETQASQLHDVKLSRRVLNPWQSRIGQIQLSGRRADAAADYFASKHTLQSWRDKTRLRADQKHAQKAKEQRLAVNYFRKWQAFVKRSKEAKYTAAYKVMRRKVKINIGRAALNNWREKTARVRGLRLLSDDFRARKDVENIRRTAHTAIIIMYNKSEELQVSAHQADGFRNKKLVERLELFGSNWLDPTKQIVENRRKADEYHTIKTAGFTLSRLRNWRNVTFRTKRLEDDADALFHRNEKKRAVSVLQKWRQGRSKAHQEQQSGTEEKLPPVTPSARRSHLLASTTPAYTPASALFRRTRVVEGFREEDEEE